MFDEVAAGISSSAAGDIFEMGSNRLLWQLACCGYLLSPRFHVTFPREARQNLPVARKGVGSMFDFQCGEKSQMYPL
jgi:hypothetical protein